MMAPEEAYRNIESELRKNPDASFSPHQRKLLFRHKNLFLKFVENETGRSGNAQGIVSLMEKLAFLKEHAIPLLTQFTEHEQKSIRQSAVSTLFSIGVPAGKTLVRCLETGHPDVITHIVERFSCFPDLSFIIPILVPVLSCLDEQQQNMLLSPVLASSFDKDDTIAELIGILMLSDLSEIRTDPLEHFLAQYAIYDTAGVQLFSNLIRCKEVSLRLAALRVLVQHGDPGVLQELSSALIHSSKSINPLVSGLSNVLTGKSNIEMSAYSTADLRAYVMRNEQLKPLRNSLHAHLNDKLNGEVLAFVLPVVNSENTVEAQINAALYHLGYPHVVENIPNRKLNFHNDLKHFIQYSGFHWCGCTSEQDASLLLKNYLNLFHETSRARKDQNPFVFTGLSNLTGTIFDKGYIFSNEELIGMIWVSDED
jgi:hypothetical protein